MKIAIAGSGAMGSRFGFMLHRAGNDVVLIDKWPAHVEAINRDGLKGDFNGEDFVEKIPASFPEDVHEHIDIVFLFTKAMQLDDMLQSIKPILSQDTQVVCLLNGLGHEDTVEKYVPKKNIHMGNTIWTAGLVGPGHIHLHGNGSVELENVEPEGEEKAKEICQILTDAGLNGKYSDNVKLAIYRKACVNGTMNGLCTMLDSNMAQLGATSTAREMITTIVNEFADVAEAEGIILDRPEVIEHCISCTDPTTIGEHYPSMHQDLIQSNRLTEIDYINGAIARKAEKYGLYTPYCKFLTELVHAREQVLGAK